MTPKASPDTVPRFQEAVFQTLLDAGFDAQTAQALLGFDVEHFQFVRRTMKGDLPQALMDELGAGLEATQFHALSAVVRINCGFGSAGTEATVGHLAEDLAVDPSRASRIASDLVERGFLRRAVSQQDARRSVLELTPAAESLFDAFRAAKWQHSIRIFRDWSAQDIQDFTRLFGAYAQGMRREYPGRG